MVGYFNTNCRRKGILVPDGSRVKRISAYSFVPLMHPNIECLAYDLKDFVTDFETTLCFHSILLYIVLCLLPIRKEVLCKNLGFSPVNTQAFKKLNSPIAFWGTTHVFEVNHSHPHLQERSLISLSIRVNVD